MTPSPRADENDRPRAVTRLLGDLADDEPSRAEELLPLVYEELRSLAVLVTHRAVERTVCRLDHRRLPSRPSPGRPGPAVRRRVAEP